MISSLFKLYLPKGYHAGEKRKMIVWGLSHDTIYFLQRSSLTRMGTQLSLFILSNPMKELKLGNFTFFFFFLASKILESAKLTSLFKVTFY